MICLLKEELGIEDMYDHMVRDFIIDTYSEQIKNIQTLF